MGGGLIGRVASMASVDHVDVDRRMAALGTLLLGIRAEGLAIEVDHRQTDRNAKIVLGRRILLYASSQDQGIMLWREPLGSLPILRRFEVYGPKHRYHFVLHGTDSVDDALVADILDFARLLGS
jgi:hypothetical protein